VTKQPDRRAEERYPVSTDAACPFLSPVVEDFGAVRIRDVSMHGVGLLVARRIEPNTLLAVVLTNPTRSFNKTVLARVVHITPVAGGFLAGCTFVTPISYQEMSSLIL
jgi:hypothetical protein